MKSTFFEVVLKSGNIFAIYDTPIFNAANSPLIVILPAYGSKGMDFSYLASFLTKNGLRVLRFDARNSVGNSYGDISNFTLNGFVQDIQEMLEFADEKLSFNLPMAAIAFSLSARGLLRYLSGNHIENLMLAISIVGVVNFRSTIKKIFGFDFLKKVAGQKVSQLFNVLGHDIHSQHFYHNSCDLFSLKSSIKDATQINVPNFVAILSENDEFISKDQVEKVILNIPSKVVEIIEIQDAPHMIWKQATFMKTAVEKTILAINKYIIQNETAKVVEPDRRFMANVMRNERDLMSQKCFNKVAYTKISCWEYKQCGREEGGDKAKELGVCPASKRNKNDKYRDCWNQCGTFCEGRIQGIFAQKIQHCSTCNFYQYVQAEETMNTSFFSQLTVS